MFAIKGFQLIEVFTLHCSYLVDLASAHVAYIITIVQYHCKKVAGDLELKQRSSPVLRNMAEKGTINETHNVVQIFDKYLIY